MTDQEKMKQSVIFWTTLLAQKEQPEQEPVAWMFQHEETGRIMCVEAQQVEGGFEKGNPRLKKIAPLYTHPPQRKPLTTEERSSIVNEALRGHASTRDAIDWAIRHVERHHGRGKKT